MSTTLIGPNLSRTPRDTSLTCAPIDNWCSKEVQTEWEGLLEQSKNLTALFQSPAWFSSLNVSSRDSEPRLLGWKTATGPLLGAVPIARGEQTLDFYVKTRMLWQSRLNAVQVLGGQPLLPEDDTTYDAVFSAIELTFPNYDCLWLPMVSTDSFCWKYLNTSRHIQE